MVTQRHVELIFGPPCAGKTTLARQLASAEPGGLIIDADLIAQELGSTVEWDHHPAITAEAQRLWRARLEQTAATRGVRAWIVRCAPTHAERARLTRITGAQHTQLLLPDRATLLVRASQRPNPETTRHAVDRWLREYQHDQQSRNVGRSRVTGRKDRRSEAW